MRGGHYLKVFIKYLLRRFYNCVEPDLLQFLQTAIKSFEDCIIGYKKHLAAQQCFAHCQTYEELCQDLQQNQYAQTEHLPKEKTILYNRAGSRNKRRFLPQAVYAKRLRDKALLKPQNFRWKNRVQIYERFSTLWKTSPSIAKNCTQ